MTTSEPVKPSAYYSHARTELLALLKPSETFREGLEIGCGNGETLGKLIADGHVLRGVGVDRWEAAIARARGILSDAIQEDVERWITNPRGVAQPDIIIAADVLEHLIDPWGVLVGLRRLQQRGGVLLLSIPNAQHYSISLRLLLQGHWRYTEEGLLDRTHLRFFTRKTITELVNSAGYVVEEWRFTAGPRGRLINQLSVGVLQPWLAYQYLVRCKAS